MKRLFLATVVTRTPAPGEGDPVQRTRTIPVYAQDIGDVEAMVRDEVEVDDLVHEAMNPGEPHHRTTVVSVDVEKTIGTPD